MLICPLWDFLNSSSRPDLRAAFVNHSSTFNRFPDTGFYKRRWARSIVRRWPEVQGCRNIFVFILYSRLVGIWKPNLNRSTTQRQLISFSCRLSSNEVVADLFLLLYVLILHHLMLVLGLLLCFGALHFSGSIFLLFSSGLIYRNSPVVNKAKFPHLASITRNTAHCSHI